MIVYSMQPISNLTQKNLNPLIYNLKQVSLIKSAGNP